MAALPPEDVKLVKLFLERLQEHEGKVEIDPAAQLFAITGSDIRQTFCGGSDVSSAKKLLETIKTLRRTFLSLENATGRSLSHAESLLMPQIRGAGMSSLNGEILGKIFNEVYIATGKTTPLQQTCRAFRESALRTPELWARVSTADDTEYHLTRSKFCKLDVTVLSNVEPLRRDRVFTEQEKIWIRRQEKNRAITFLTLLKSHVSRWKSFRWHERNDEISLMQLLGSHAFPKKFPALQQLDIDYHYPDNRGPESLQNADVAAKDFLSQWDMPALTSLSLRNFIPSRIQANPRCLGFEWCSVNGEAETLDLTRLPSLLGAFDSLKELSITLTNVFDSHHNGSQASLMQLEVLSLRIDGTLEPVTRDLLDTLNAPNVRFLSIVNDTDWEPDATPLLAILFPEDMTRWPHVEDLDIQEPHVPLEPGQTPALHYALTRLPKTTKLTVRYCCEASKHVGYDDNPDRYDMPSVKLAVHSLLVREADPASIPPLQYLCLDSCTLDNTFIIENIDVVSAPVFKKLWINECPNMDMNVIRSFLPTDKVLISDGEEIPPIRI